MRTLSENKGPKMETGKRPSSPIPESEAGTPLTVNTGPSRRYENRETVNGKGSV